MAAKPRYVLQQQPVRVTLLATPCLGGGIRAGTPWPLGRWASCSKDGKPHGEQTSWFDNGKIRRRAFYIEGQPHGTWVDRYRDGTMNVSHWDRGIRVGSWRTYDREGRLVREQFYGDGGRRVFRTWYTNGQLAREQLYEQNQPIGVWRNWNQDGKLTWERKYGARR